ncbi:MAG: UDP-N-acetylglucosamine 4,6-dehydratase (inverting) [Methylococcales bacterium]|jgi:UDP-N-acetylglucosamine 4,6-dehydratase/5-epimerase|nr:UDP-N-acetylglucosamine 4,6-dehydratase (inverting) [Methylococcales bacterium]MBT7444744.1 UDP-N-acetylglucosamine 4,6-dehydratase (inverting) [Methylococcales bacterium]
MSVFEGKSVLVTGATGSFGKRFVEMILKAHNPRRVVVFSRDELKQFEMQKQFPASNVLKYFLGDVRDRERLYRAVDGVDIVIHAAAIKQVPAAEFNPMEAIKTNIIGANNLIEVCIDRNVERVIALSTDKAANPANLYGATKLCSDKLFVSANALSGHHKTRFSVVRYGNVVGSRGSVIPFFMELKKTGVLPITDARMTRFWITLKQGLQFVVDNLERMHGGEIFIPKIPSMTMLEVAKAIAPECEIKIIGVRPGEKLHEIMITQDDAINTLEYDDYYVIQPAAPWWYRDSFIRQTNAKPVSELFQYSSDQNSQWMLADDLNTLLSDEEIEH